MARVDDGTSKEEEEEEEADFERKTRRYIDWLLANGAVISDDIEVADLRASGRGRGVVAKADIAASSLLFAIPRSLALTARSARLPRSLASALPAEPWLALIAALMWRHLSVLSLPRTTGSGSESAAAATSAAAADVFWKPYLDVLPEEFETPMFWAEEELAWLQASGMRGEVGRDVEGAEEGQFRGVILPLFENMGLDLGEQEEGREEMLLRLFHVAGSRIMAYAFDVDEESESESESASASPGRGAKDEDKDADDISTIEEEFEECEDDDDDDDELPQPKAMIPLADTLNAEGPHAANCRLYTTRTHYEMRALHPIPASAELLNDYGPLSRATLLRRYGYVPDSSFPSSSSFPQSKAAQEQQRHDTATLTLPDITTAITAECPSQHHTTTILDDLNERLDLMRQIDGEILDDDDSPSALFHVSNTAAAAGNSSAVLTDVFSAELLTVVWALMSPTTRMLKRLVLAGVKGLGALEAAKKKGKKKLGKKEEAGPPLLRVLRGACVGALGRYGTSVEEDRAELDRLTRKDGGGDGDGGGKLRRKEMAIQVRIGEKEVLRNAARVVERLLSEVSSSSSAASGEKRADKRERRLEKPVKASGRTTGNKGIDNGRKRNEGRRDRKRAKLR